MIQREINIINERLEWQSTRLDRTEGVGKGLIKNYCELKRIYPFAILPKIKANIRKALCRALELHLQMYKQTEYPDENFNNKRKYEVIKEMEKEIKELNSLTNSTHPSNSASAECVTDR